MKLIWRYKLLTKSGTIFGLWKPGSSGRQSPIYRQKQILNNPSNPHVFAGQDKEQLRKDSVYKQTLWCLVWCKIVKFEAISADIQCNY